MLGSVRGVVPDVYGGDSYRDRYAAYARYAQQSDKTVHAQCWIHSRRKFIEAEGRDPAAAKQALDHIGQLYFIEQQIKDQGLTDTKKRAI